MLRRSCWRVKSFDRHERGAKYASKQRGVPAKAPAGLFVVYPTNKKETRMAEAASGWKPEREVEIVATTPPGGGTDRSARALLKSLEANKLLDVPARVVNIAGDGGRKAWVELAPRAGDPHVIGISSPNLVTDVLTGIVKQGQLRYTSIAILYTEYMSFVTPADSPFRSGDDLLKKLAAAPQDVTLGISTSVGNPNHIAAAKVVKHAGADTKAPKIRVFDSARDNVADVVAGGCDVGIVTAASAVPELQSGQVRAIAITGAQRLAGIYASVPTWKEQSVDCVIGSWRGGAGVEGISAESVKYWEGVLSKAVRTNAWKEECEKYFWTEMYLDGDALQDYLKTEYAEMRAALRDLGLLAV
jgi:putative tricarboxylic transport membrane protein